MPAVELVAVAKRFGPVVALDGLSLAVEPGTALCLFGPSGCGKTTALRLVAGFEMPDAGEVRIDGVSVSRKDSFLPPSKRGVAMVFQDLALWPHMRVDRHLDFVLRPRGLSRRDRATCIRELLEICRLSGRSRSYPHELSGGQQQRLAIARALATEPRILLLDEPFTGLDSELRDLLRDEIMRLKREKGIAILFSTHRREEMDALADAVLDMEEKP